MDFTIFGFNLSNIFTTISMSISNELYQKSSKSARSKNFSKNLNFATIFTRFQFMTQLYHKNWLKSLKLAKNMEKIEKKIEFFIFLEFSINEINKKWIFGFLRIFLYFQFLLILYENGELILPFWNALYVYFIGLIGIFDNSVPRECNAYFCVSHFFMYRPYNVARNFKINK